MLFFAFAPPSANRASAGHGAPPRWWPDWKLPLIWLLGVAFGCNNAQFFAVNAFLPEYLVTAGRPDLIAAALAALNGSQLVASTLLLFGARRMEGRVWPFLLFGLAALAGVLGLVLGSGAWIVIAAAAVGACSAVTFVLIFAMAPALSPPGEAHRISAGMFTISYAIAVVIPILCGALWDRTGAPFTAFVLPALCALVLTLLGVVLALHRPARDAGEAVLDGGQSARKLRT